jgi:hypothetical protein
MSMLELIDLFRHDPMESSYGAPHYRYKSPSGMACSPDGGTLYCAYGQYNVLAWDVSSQRLIGSAALPWGEDGGMLRTSDIRTGPQRTTLLLLASEEAVLWDLASGGPLQSVFAALPDEEALLKEPRDDGWDDDDLFDLDEEKPPIYDACLSRDGCSVIVADALAISHWPAANARGPATSWRWSSPVGGAHELSLSRCGTRLAGAMADGSISVLDPTGPTLLHTLPPYGTSAATAVAFGDINTVIAGYSDGMLLVFRVEE